jgi:hypothetical protein
MQITISLGEKKEIPVTAAIKNPAKVIKAKDHKVNLKLSAHMICITLGIAITIILTFVPAEWVIHASGILVAGPAFVQEFIDWAKEL